MSKKIKYCSTCGNRARTNTNEDACIFHSTNNHIHIIHNPEAEFCHAHTTAEAFDQCDICKAVVNKDTSVICLKDDGTVNLICLNCNNGFNTCKTCGNSRSCDFITNPTPIPQQVKKTVRQGNAIIQTMVINPDRVAETCMKNCKCWSHEHNYCRRENDEWCVNYNENINS